MAISPAQGQVRLMLYYFLVMIFVMLIVYSKTIEMSADSISTAIFERNKVKTHFEDGRPLV